MSERGGNSCKTVHVINVEIKDNHDDATLGAFVIHELAKEVRAQKFHIINFTNRHFRFVNFLLYLLIHESIITNFISP